MYRERGRGGWNKSKEWCPFYLLLIGSLQRISDWRMTEDFSRKFSKRDPKWWQYTWNSYSMNMKFRLPHLSSRRNNTKYYSLFYTSCNKTPLSIVFFVKFFVDSIMIDWWNVELWIKRKRNSMSRNSRLNDFPLSLFIKFLLHRENFYRRFGIDRWASLTMRLKVIEFIMNV